ncbi:N-acyl-D-amino-acid deacylase family protein [Cellulomonas hominis]
MTDLLVRGALVAGAGGTRIGDLRISAGRFVEAGPDLVAGPAEVLQADGLVALPGFVDAHVHADAGVLDGDVQAALTHQGVTTVVLGQDGLSFAPSGSGTHDAQAFVERYFATINGTHPTFRGGGVRELLDTYDQRTTVNTVYQVPHGTLRYAVMGPAERAARPDEVRAMVALLEAGLDAGARGMSTGLEYAPACYAAPAELVALCEVLARRGLPHSSHMRGYEDRADAAVAELVALARQTGVATHISHYHGPGERLAALVDDALADGLDLTFDSYPYLRGASILALLALPTWLPLADGDRVVAMLGDPLVLDRLRREELPARADVWPRVTLSDVPSPEYRWTEGRTLVDVADRLGEPPAETALRLLVATGLRVGCVFAQPPTNSEESVRRLLRHPAHCAGSDGIYLGGRPHPRGWGTFARYVAHHVRELGDWDWDQAAQHLATTAARRFVLPDRGRIASGARADLVLLDPAAVTDVADYHDPCRPAQGVRHVLVDGTFTLRDGTLTGALPGVAIR